MLLNLACEVGGAVDDGRGAKSGSCTCAIFSQSSANLLDNASKQGQEL